MRDTLYSFCINFDTYHFWYNSTFRCNIFVT